MTHPNNDMLADLERACEAAGRGDLRAAERWTGLAERKLAMMRRLCELAIKQGWKPDMIELINKAQARRKAASDASAEAEPESNSDALALSPAPSGE